MLYTALYEGHTELSNAEELHVSAVYKRIGCGLIVGAKKQRTETGKPLIAPNDLTAFLFTTGCSTVLSEEPKRALYCTANSFCLWPQSCEFMLHCLFKV